MKINEFVKKYSTVILLLAVVAFFSIMTDSFLATRNMINILRQVAVLSILSAGMTFVIISGGMDLTVGSMLGLTGVVCAKFIVELQIHPVISIILTVLLMTLFGTLTGLLIVKLHVAPMVITLGMMTVARGLAYIFSGGIPIYKIPEGVVFLGQGKIGPIPVPVITMIIIVLRANYVRNKSYYG